MKKILVCILSVILLVSMFPICTFATNTTNETLTIDELPTNIKYLIENSFDKTSSKDVKIIPSNSLFELNLIHSDGTGTTQLYGAPVSYLADGKYNFIDTSIVRTENKSEIANGYTYKNSSNSFSVLFSNNSNQGINVNQAFTISAISSNKSNIKNEAVVTKDEHFDGKIIYPEAFGENTILEYINVPRGIKSNIIITNKIASNSFSFVFNSKTHIPVLSSDKKTVNIVQIKDASKVDFCLPEMYAYDSFLSTIGDEYSNQEKQNKHFTEDCYYDVLKNEDESYVITIEISKSFLENPKTIFPVTIDPSVVVEKTVNNIEDTFVSQGAPTTNYGSNAYLRFGYYNYHTSSNHKMFTYIRFKNLPTNNSISSYSIKNAYLRVNFVSGTTTSYEGKVYRVKANNWNESTLTWNNQPYGYDCGTTSSHNNCSYYNFNITKIVKGWYNGDYPNYGVDLTYSNETHYDYNLLHSSDGTLANSPTLTINYNVAQKTTYTNSGQASANSSYNRKTAAEYAEEYGEYASTNVWDTPSYKSAKTAPSNVFGLFGGSDCTNFVSQCLHEGGMIYLGNTKESNASWYYSTTLGLYQAAYPWGGAPNFYKHWGHDDSNIATQRSYITVVYDSLQDALYDWTYIKNTFSRGDVIQLIYSDGIGHTMILYNTSEMLYAQHSSNKIEQSLESKLQSWLNDSDSDVVGIILHRIK